MITLQSGTKVMKHQQIIIMEGWVVTYEPLGKGSLYPRKKSGLKPRIKKKVWTLAFPSPRFLDYKKDPKRFFKSLFFFGTQPPFWINPDFFRGKG